MKRYEKYEESEGMVRIRKVGGRWWAPVALFAVTAVVGAAGWTGSAMATPLPDGRGYELVTTTDSGYGFGLSTVIGGVITSGLARSSQDGDGVAFTTGSPPPDSQSGALAQWSLGRRTPSGWVDRSLSPPQDPEFESGQFGQFPGFSSDLAQAVVTQKSPTLVPEATPNLAALYREDTATGAFSLVTGQPQPDSSVGVGVKNPDMVGASTDLRDVAYNTYGGVRQTADTPAGVDSEIYESVDGQVRLVGILPDGSAVPDGASATTGMPSTVSADGSHVFFSANPPQNPPRVNDLYARIGGDRTVDVSPSVRTTPDPRGQQSRVFSGASADGSKALFTSSEELTDDATTDPTSPTSDLYQFDLDTGALHDLSVDGDPADAATGANVLGVVAFSPSQNDVYFVATGDLAPGASDGAPNLYVAHDRAVRFIATLDSSDNALWGGGPTDLPIGGQVASASGDLLFSTVAPITGYDSTDASTGRPDRELFRYDPAADRLICVSCNPTGAEPQGPSITVPAISQDVMEVQGRNIDSAGTRVFFESRDALVPGDTDGASDVYEWEQDGVGSCSSSADVGGCVSLLTPGDVDGDAHMVESDPSGSNVFISTLESLGSQDANAVNNLYDVRVGGGFPASTLVAPAKCVSSQSCQGSPPVPAAVPEAATVTFNGPADSRPRAAASRATVLARHVRGYRFSLRVKVPRGGRVTVTGPSVTTTRHRFPAAGAATLKLTLDRAARRQLLRRHRLTRVKVRIAYFPATGRGAAHTITLSFTEAGR